MKLYTIEWHKNCLRNMIVNYQKKQDYLDQEIAHNNRLLEKIEFLKYQILEAEKEGKEKFDPDRFGIKRTHIKDLKKVE